MANATESSLQPNFSLDPHYLLDFTSIDTVTRYVVATKWRTSIKPRNLVYFCKKNNNNNWHSTLSWLTALYSWTEKSPNRSSTPGSCFVGFPELEASRQWLEPGLKQSQNGICERVSEWVWCSALQCSAVWHHPKPNNFPEILTIWKEKMNLNRNWLTAARRTHATYHGFEARS